MAEPQWTEVPSSLGQGKAAESLTAEQKRHFIEHGWIKLTDCFTKKHADWVNQDVWARLGMDPDNKSTWRRLQTHMPAHRMFPISTFSPKAWSAITELCGGRERITEASAVWGDALIVNLGSPEFEGTETQHRELDGWHIDGDFFVHYLDSPEQALLVIPLFTDIAPGGGATVICPEAIPKLARHLHDHPEGVSPYMAPRGDKHFPEELDTTWFNQVAKSCSPSSFIEASGQVGDVFLLHPLMLHSASRNPQRRLRLIINPPVAFKEPQCFDRPGGDYNLVEKTTLQALGRNSLPGWKITAPREERVPARIRMQAAMKEEELKRMERTGGR